jgi:RNA recognition motif-containing protein
MKLMGTRLYVGNLAHGTNEAILRMAFGQNGRKVTHVELAMDAETGKPKRFGYVEMASNADAQAAIRALNGTDLDGRDLQVSESVRRERH